MYHDHSLRGEEVLSGIIPLCLFPFPLSALLCADNAWEQKGGIVSMYLISEMNLVQMDIYRLDCWE